MTPTTAAAGAATKVLGRSLRAWCVKFSAVLTRHLSTNYPTMHGALAPKALQPSCLAVVALNLRQSEEEFTIYQRRDCVATASSLCCNLRPLTCSNTADSSDRTHRALLPKRCTRLEKVGHTPSKKTSRMGVCLSSGLGPHAMVCSECAIYDVELPHRHLILWAATRCEHVSNGWPSYCQPA